MYVPSHTSLRHHPKLSRFARILDVSSVTAIGHLHAFWWWTIEYSPTGDLSRFDDEDIADGAMWTGDPRLFVSALEECGPGGTTGFIKDKQVHEWEEYAGRLAKKRQSDRERKRKEREQKKNSTPKNDIDKVDPTGLGTSSGQNATVPEAGSVTSHTSGETVTTPCGVTSTDPSHGRHTDVRGSHTLKKRKEKQNLNPPLSPPPEGGACDQPTLVVHSGHDPDDDPGPDLDAERFNEHFWPTFPARNGKKLGKAKALTLWRKLTIDQQRRALKGAKNLALSEQLPPDAHRFLRRDRATKEFPFDDWQTPGSTHTHRQQYRDNERGTVIV